MKHIVGFSGGADSQATSLWVRRRFPAEDVILLNTQAGGNECPVTADFIQRYSVSVFPVIVITPLICDLVDVGTRPGVNPTRDRRQEFSEDDPLTFDRLAYIKGRFPWRKAQFCTEYLKLRPQQRWIRENLVEKNIEYTRYIGVRRDESHARRNVADCDYDTFFNCNTHRPIASWTKQEVFAYIKDAGEQVNPLYMMGFGRVGCAPCINSGKDDIRTWSARFPEMIDKVRSWEKSVGRTFFPPIVPGKEINWIDEVVEWSKTARGGRQPLLQFVEADAENHLCESKWGLCE